MRMRRVAYIILLACAVFSILAFYFFVNTKDSTVIQGNRDGTPKSVIVAPKKIKYASLPVRDGLPIKISKDAKPANLINGKAFSVSTCLLNPRAADLLGLTSMQLDFANACISKCMHSISSAESKIVTLERVDDHTIKFTYADDLPVKYIADSLKQQLSEQLPDTAIESIAQSLSRTASFHAFRKGYSGLIKSMDDQIGFVFGNVVPSGQFGPLTVMASVNKIGQSIDYFSASFLISGNELSSYPRWTWLGGLTAAPPP